MAAPRDPPLCMRLDDETAAALVAYVAASGLTRNMVLKQMIRRACGLPDLPPRVATVAVRLPAALVTEVSDYARERGSDRSAVIAGLIREGLQSESQIAPEGEG